MGLNSFTLQLNDSDFVNSPGSVFTLAAPFVQSTFEILSTTNGGETPNEFVVDPGATVSIQNQNKLQFQIMEDGDHVLFRNNGTVAVSGTSSLEVHGPTENTGTFNIGSADSTVTFMQLLGFNFTQSLTGVAINGPGLFLYSSQNSFSELTLAGTNNFTNFKTTENNLGRVGLNGTINIASGGSFVWGQGDLVGEFDGGTLIVAPNANLFVTGLLGIQRSLRNNFRIVNNGVFTFHANLTISGLFASDLVIVNNGLMKVNGGSITYDYAGEYAVFQNNGLVQMLAPVAVHFDMLLTGNGSEIDPDNLLSWY